jgi:hypothetical protein
MVKLQFPQMDYWTNSGNHTHNNKGPNDETAGNWKFPENKIPDDIVQIEAIPVLGPRPNNLYGYSW